MANERKLLAFPDDAYVVVETWGNCNVCGRHQDLRFGSCYSCADFVDGKPILGGYELWDSRNPTNRWQVKAN